MSSAVRNSILASLRPKLPVRRLVRNEEGATAVEFALIALPFFALIFAIIETAMVLWTGQLLDNAVTDAARRIYTGQFQNEMAKGKVPANQLAGKFRDEICKNVVAMFSCSDVMVDVRSLDSFPNNMPESPLTDGAVDPAKFGKYEPPQPNKVVVVRALVEYPVMASLLDPNQTNLASRRRLLMSTATFKTEPYAQ